MFTKSLPDQKVAEFEKRSLESKNNTKQKPQRDLRSKKSKEEQGPQVHLELVRRPGYGTRGKLINLSANFLSMMFKPGATFYAYTVKIVPEPRVKRHIKQIFKQLLLKCPEIQSCLAATDEAQWILTCKKILCDEVSVFCDPDDQGKFSVEYTCGLDLVDDEPIPLQQLLNGLANPDIHEKVSDEDYVIQMLNILMTSHAYGDKGIAIVGKGRLKFFYIDNRQESMNLTGGLEVLRGCISSVRPAGTQLLLNLNVSNSAFYQSMNLAHFIEEVLRQNWDDLEILNRYLRGVKVELRYGNQIYNDFKEKVYRTNSIWGLASKEDEERHDSKDIRPPKVRKFGAGPDDVQFWFKEDGRSGGQYITVTQFFKNSKST